MAFAARARFAWKLRTRTLALGERTLVMAIVNLTPDSFSGDGLAGAAVAEAVKKACGGRGAARAAGGGGRGRRAPKGLVPGRHVPRSHGGGCGTRWRRDRERCFGDA